MKGEWMWMKFKKKRMKWSQQKRIKFKCLKGKEKKKEILSMNWFMNDLIEKKVQRKKRQPKQMKGKFKTFKKKEKNAHRYIWI